MYTLARREGGREGGRKEGEWQGGKEGRKEGGREGGRWMDGMGLIPPCPCDKSKRSPVKRGTLHYGAGFDLKLLRLAPRPNGETELAPIVSFPDFLRNPFPCESRDGYGKPRGCHGSSLVLSQKKKKISQL